MNFINSKISIFSMVTGFILLTFLVNRGILNHEDISIMYYLMGIIAAVYVLSWALFAGIVYKIIRFVFFRHSH